MGALGQAKLRFILFRSDDVDHEVTGYSYDMLSPHGHPLASPARENVRRCQLLHLERKLVFALAL